MTLFVDSSVWFLAFGRDEASGLVPQELLHGFAGPRAQEFIERFAALPLLAQVGTIDALLAQLCIRHELTLLTTDDDFVRAASHCPLRVWKQDR